MNEIKKIKWHKLRVSDEAELSGTSIQKLLKCIMKVEQFKFVILDNVEVVGEEWFMYILNQKNVMRLKDLMFTLPDAQQFEWGDIYLFKKFPKSWDRPEKTTYPYLINQTDTTIRVDDYFYMIVYTPHDSVVEIKKNYEIQEIKTDFLENLGYPSKEM